MIRSPEPDIYGPYARASLLADYVELTALQGRPVKRAAVADFLAGSDNTWDLELTRSAGRDPIDEESKALSEQLDKARDDASIVFRQMDERRHMLTDRYPFEISGDIVSLAPDVDQETNPYVALLALTVAHAFSTSSRRLVRKCYSSRR